MGIGPFSPLLVKGGSRRQAALLRFPQGGSAQSQERRKNVRNVAAHLPSAADLLSGRIGSRAAPLGWPGQR